MLWPTVPLGELDFPFPFVVVNIFAFAALLASIAFRMLGYADVMLFDKFCLFRKMPSVVFSMKTLLDCIPLPPFGLFVCVVF